MSFFFNPSQGPGVLTNSYGQPVQQGYMSPIMQAQAMQNGATGNARGSMRMPQMPDNRIDLNEALIRAGGNIVGAAADGPLAAFKAGTDSFGKVMDYNRQADIDRYNAEYAQAKAEEERALQLTDVYKKLYTVSTRYILVAEYYNPSPVSINYRGHSDKLFKRDFAGEMLDTFPDLRLVDYGFAYHRDVLKKNMKVM